MSDACLGCPLVNFRLLPEAGSSLTGKITLNAENNIEVKTDTGFTETVNLEGYFDEV